MIKQRMYWWKSRLSPNLLNNEKEKIMTYYSDPEKENRLNQAIELGFIEKHIDSDGIVRYVLTNKGLNKWQFEKIFGV